MWLSLVGLVVILMPAASHALTLVTRQDPVDHFLIPGRCKAETCVMESSGTGELGGTCTCRCLPHLPVFREDLQLCVDDIHECPLAPFATGSVLQKVPYVFLPLKGQIINPSSEIVLSSISIPMCVISSAKYLTPSGWVELKNKSDTYEPPFRLYRDEGRNYLQWLGGADLRLAMEGRLLLINMMCKDGSNTNNVLLNPCVAFRVSGTPSETNKWSVGVKEVSFTTEAQSSGGGGMGSGYVAVALCSLALGIAYAVGVVWYLKKKNSKEAQTPEGGHPGVVEEGVVKNNPLLRHCQEAQPPYPANQPESGCSDSDDCSEIFHSIEEMTPKPSSPANLQVTSAMIHPRCDGFECRQDELSDIDSEGTADSSNIERHPEENVSIVEAHENREDRLGIVSSQTGRRKLYFNPAYFEHELLLAPPPAAIEFLTKIREVMSIAKAKMEAKRFLPSLLGIAEEKEYECGSAMDVIDCVSCRSNKTNKIKCSKGAQCEGSTMSCHNNHNCSNDNKVNSIRKWLEDVPCIKPAFAGNNHSQPSAQHEYTASIASSSRGSSKGSFLSRTSTIKESANYAENLYTNHDITPDTKGALTPVLNISKDDHVYEPNDYKPNQYNPNQYDPNIYEQNQYEPTSCNEVEDSASEIDENIYMEQRYEKFSLRSCRDESMNYECITENTCKELGIGIAKSGFSTPTEYADIRPNIIEKVNCSMVFNHNSGNEYLTVGSEPVPVGDNREDHDYEMIMVESVELNETKSLPDFPNDNHSFISEVYVQHSFRDNVYPRSDSSLNSNDSSTNSLLSNHAQNDDQGLLTIKVEGKKAPKEEYESDYFDPDTLDRKPAKLTIHGEPPNPADVTVDFFTDSLERQPQIALKSNGSFRNNEPVSGHPHLAQRNRHVTLNKAFGSLREIFVAKNRYNQCHHRPPFSGLLGSNKTLNQVSNFRWNKERYKTLKPESRQAKRQRAPSPRNVNIPPIPIEVEDHEYNNISLDLDKPPPLPARKGRKSAATPPPVPDFAPPKREKRQNLGIRNGSVRSSIRMFNKLPELTNGNECRQLRGRQLVTAPGSNSTTEYEFMTNENREKKPQFYLRKINQENGSERSTSKKIYRQGHRTEDSGYLSTDSNNSYKGGRRGEREGAGSETDDSFFDGASESGAESIATDSFSFGKHLHTTTLPHYSLHDGPTENI